MSILRIKNILTFLQSQPEIESFVKHYENNETGFMFSQDSRLKLIMDAVDNDGHTGASFACTLRACQSILLGIRTIDEYIQMEAESNGIWRKQSEEEQGEQQQAEQQQAEQQQAEQQQQQQQQAEQQQEQAEQQQQQAEGYTYYS